VPLKGKPMRIAAHVLAGLSLLAMSAAATELTGWISDAACGKANAKADASARECAEACIKAGAPPVLVTDNEQKVYKLVGKFDAKAHLKHKVKVSGKVNGDTITVESMTKAE